MTRLSLLAILAISSSGCRQTPPTLAGGKPVSYWARALQSPDAKLRKTAVSKLGNVGPTDSAVWPALREALKDRDASVRREAILALMKFGPGARGAIPDLTELSQRDPDELVRGDAAQALRKLSGEAGLPR